MTRELSHVTRSPFPPSPLLYAPIADQHQRAPTEAAFVHARSVPYGGVQWRSEVDAVPCASQHLFPPINHPFYAPPSPFLFLFRQPRANQPPPSREVPPPPSTTVYMRLYSLSLSLSLLVFRAIFYSSSSSFRFSAASLLFNGE